MTSQPADPSSDAARTPPERRRVQLRRAPKYVPFLIAGALVGVVVAGILTLISPGIENFDPSSIFGFFAVLLVLPGAGLGAVVALVIDRRSLRHSLTAVVESVPEHDDGSPASA
ncbi:putative membrane protein [Arthrobacter silviterrae]|uniref:MFS transporter n=1 Tax=Arthrobacter silviterrae TaxID=2026658 RepID=A0ABX0DDS8_9MICC|nr:MFS transporter [Arthrobacter silviterrae]MDQ0277975.1 putative membrane protein [Arthrobacter silviterrae]NGN83529.1 MFS transporter [Arthrobacter silviterrae]